MSMKSREKSLLDFKLRPKQYETVLNFVRGRDVYVSLPTEWEKSLLWCSTRDF